MCTGKDFVRRQIAAERKAYTEVLRNEENKAIAAHFLRSAVYSESHTVMCYVSMDVEADTHAVIRAMLRDGKTVCVPQVMDRCGTMRAVRIESWDMLKATGSFGILEPEADRVSIILPDMIDLIIVPGVGFTRDGARIGMGGGYYDRFLSQSRAVRMGFAFICQIKDSLPTDAWDVRMDYLVTKDGITDCRTSKVQG
ncbi:MAG: 5-formyltetrahydrofolate cyclo-ligase [Selenomonadales bacterium]|nr:5-formyltetrahydrofolate cyclo-ligase [Selenomonadales bacterium]